MPLEPGTPAPPLEEAPASPYALLFYTVTCPTCLRGAPTLAALAAAYPGRILAVGLYPPDRLEAFDRRFGLGLPAIADAEPYAISDDWAIRTVPTVYVIDGAGAVDDVVEGWDREGLNRASGTLAGLLGVDAIRLSEAGDGLPAFKPG